MSAQAIIRRYKKTIDILETGQFPSMDSIQEFIEDTGLKASRRTIERDFEVIRNEFGVEIEYDQHKKGYFINKEEGLSMDSFLRLLELVETAHVFQESLKESKETLEYIDFEHQGISSGIDYLQPILKAIRNHLRIRFKHESYQTGKFKRYQVKPYLLKEYLGRWYVIGEVSGMNAIRTFGIDRVSEFELLTETFEPKDNYEIKARFRDVIGLTYEGSDKQEIILSFKPEQVPYLKSLPLHHSQTFIEENENEALVRYFLKPNYEFTQRIFMHIEKVKVLEPEWLVEQVKEKIDEIREMYE
jgi:proteasome accessory factor B